MMFSRRASPFALLDIPVSSSPNRSSLAPSDCRRTTALNIAPRPPGQPSCDSAQAKIKRQSSASLPHEVTGECNSQ